MDQIIIILAGAVILAAFGYGIYLLSRREQYRGKEIGYIIIDYATTNAMTVLFILMTGCIVSEGWIAASLAVDDPKHTINPVARILAHTALTFINLLGTLFFVKELQQIIKVFKSKSFIYIFYYLSLLLISGLLTVVPIGVNLQVVANHLEQEQPLAILYAYLFESSAIYQTKIEMLQLNTITFNPLFHVHPVMIVSAGISVVHIMVAIFEGLLLVITAYRSNIINGKMKDSGFKVTSVKKESSAPKEEQPTTEVPVTVVPKQTLEDRTLSSAITTLLTYLGYSGSSLDSTRSIMLNAFKIALTNMSDNKQASIATSLARLLVYIEKTPKREGDDLFKRTLVNALRAPIGEISTTRFTDDNGEMVTIPGFNVSLEIFT